MDLLFWNKQSCAHAAEFHQELQSCTVEISIQTEINFLKFKLIQINLNYKEWDPV